jgi:hypothetical protein
MARKRARPGAGPGAISRGYFPNRALDHGMRFLPLCAFCERLLSNSRRAFSLREIHRILHTCHASNRLLPRSRRLANPA